MSVGGVVVFRCRLGVVGVGVVNSLVFGVALAGFVCGAKRKSRHVIGRAESAAAGLVPLQLLSRA